MAERKKAARSSSGCTLSIRVIPRSSRIVIQQEGANLYKVKLTAPPVEGKANEQLIKTLANRLSIPAKSICIVSGPHSRLKQIRIDQMDEETVSSLLAAVE